MTDLQWIQNWYYRHCNGDWEHEKNIRLNTLDNPGWSISINLEHTELQGKEFQEIEINRTDENWLICFVKENRFEGRCGPLNLSEIIQIFRHWVGE